jgi:hypothetical protein
MYKLLWIFLFVTLIIILSCDDKAFFVQCSECTPEEPSTAELYADLDSDHYYGALVQIWEGNLEDSILVGDYTTYSKTFIQSVTLNKTYTITATYLISGSKYITVDSATPRVKLEKSQCEEQCYYIYDRKCNLRLKYTH